MLGFGAAFALFLAWWLDLRRLPQSAFLAEADGGEPYHPSDRRRTSQPTAADPTVSRRLSRGDGSRRRPCRVRPSDSPSRARRRPARGRRARRAGRRSARCRSGRCRRRSARSRARRLARRSRRCAASGSSSSAIRPSTATRRRRASRRAPRARRASTWGWRCRRR